MHYISVAMFLACLLWGYASCCAYYQGLLVKPSFATNVQDVFIVCSLSQHVSAYLMAILMQIIQNIKRTCYFYNGSVVFSIIICESCRQLIAVVFTGVTHCFPCFDITQCVAPLCISGN
jgi:hypothetical protein